MAFADVNGARLFYTDEGAGKPVVLVHGYTCDSHDWSYQIPALLEAGYRVIALDLRGHGKSSVPESGYTPRGYAADVAGLLKTLDAAPAVAVGHSMGGATVVALAVEHPASVRAIVPVDSAYGMALESAGTLVELTAGLSGPQAHAVAKQFFLGSFYPPASPPHLRTHHARRLEGVDALTLREAFKGMFEPADSFALKPASERYLAQVASPALAFRAGNQDPMTVAQWERSCFKHPYSKAVGWEGTGHFLHQERPAEFNAILLAWLAGLPA